MLLNYHVYVITSAIIITVVIVIILIIMIIIIIIIIIGSYKPRIHLVSNRLNIHSDPVVQLNEPVIICSKCGGHGHSKASCLYTRAMDTSIMSSEDSMFWTFVHPCDRPESLVGDWSCEDMSVDSNSDPAYSDTSEYDSDTSDTDTQSSDSASDNDFLAD